MAALVGAASAAVAQTPVETARERAARLGEQVVNAHASVSELQRRILSLASNVAAARISDGRVRVAAARVFETLQPVDAIAEYAPGS